MRASALIAVLLVAPALLLVAACGAAETVDTPSEFFLPVGDVAAGREAFIGLKCHYCHAVEFDAEMPEPVGEVKGPAIGARQAAQSDDQITMSIVSPGHEMPPLMREPISPMGDYRHVMTVLQLADIVAFVGQHR